jgi:hypothetical protein
MANFFPPSQLPPLKGPVQLASEQGQQPVTSRVIRTAAFLGFVRVGLLVAAIGFRVTGGVQWFFALPVAAAIGWYIAANWSRSSIGSIQGDSESGPVVW